MSDGSIQNKYTLKLLNKTKHPITVKYEVSGIKGITIHGLSDEITIDPGKVIPVSAFVRVPEEHLGKDIVPITFTADVLSDEGISARYKSMFMGPK